MKKSLLIVLSIWGLVLSVCAQPATDTGVLLNAYTRFVFASEVQAQILKLAQSMPEADAEQVKGEAAQWMTSEGEALRADLDERFGDEARDRFAEFVSEYTTAEKENNLHYLGLLASAGKLGETPFEFPAMRTLVMNKWLEAPVTDGSRLLGEIQTWGEVRALSPQTPPLTAWLHRGDTPASVKPVNPLAAAEASAPEWVVPATPAPMNPMDAFAQSRTEKRARALADSQAGMQQMAMERQAAESEYAAKKMAEATADADAMRAQAQKLAATEKEAIDQRANSWSGRLKKIVSATVGAATGAFTGGIGAEAGRQAAEAIFPR